MTHLLLRRQAIELRKKRLSYSQTKQALGISKSTLSDWLRNMPLTREETNNLRANNECRIEKCRNTKRLKRLIRHRQYYKEQKQKLFPLTHKELLLCGICLYWSEALCINSSNFAKPYIKSSRRSDIDHKGYGHGTCCIIVCDTVLKEKLLEPVWKVSFERNWFGFERKA